MGATLPSYIARPRQGPRQSPTPNGRQALVAGQFDRRKPPCYKGLLHFCRRSSAVEQLIRNQQVDGSIPPAGSKEIKGLARVADLFLVEKSRTVPKLCP